MDQKAVVEPKAQADFFPNRDVFPISLGWITGKFPLR